jgi:hypothetical protein
VKSYIARFAAEVEMFWGPESHERRGKNYKSRYGELVAYPKKYKTKRYKFQYGNAK